MSVRLTTSQILAAARQKRQAQVGSAGAQIAAAAAVPAAEATTSTAEATRTAGSLSSGEQAELAAYLPRTFSPDAAAPRSLAHPLATYALTAPAGSPPLPRIAHVLPDFISVAEEQQLLCLVGESPPSSWTQLKRRSLQMWGGFPPAGVDTEFRPSPLPAWQGQLIERLVAQGAASAELPPNHVLLNRYERGQGIMPHQDGALYAPRVAILSMGSHTCMHFYAHLADSLPGAAHRPAFTVYLPPRSLFLFSEELYTRYFHAIDERTQDELDDAVLNVPPELRGQTIQRGTRVSLTIRRVHTVAERQEAVRQHEAASSSAGSDAPALPAAAASSSVSSSSFSSVTAATMSSPSPSSSSSPTSPAPHTVPVIDLTDLLAPGSSTPSGPSEGRKRVAQEIYKACTTMGFFYISHHGISEELQSRLDRLSREFFALPLEQKMEISMEKGGRAWRGYFPCFGELTSGKPDIKEGLYLGTELPPTHPLVSSCTPMHGPNLFPDAALPSLRPTVLEYMDRVTHLAHALMEALALGLGLDEQYFRQHYTHDPTVLFRLFNYPEHATNAREADSWGVGEHTDYGVLTILRQDHSGGLQVKSPAHGWIEAPPIAGTLICNLGDMLERLTGGRFQSTPHRVRNLAAGDRISFPFFFDPSWHAEVLPLPLDHLPPPVVSDSRLSRWDKSSVHEFKGTYGQYLLNKVGKVFPDLAEKKKIAEANQAASSKVVAIPQSFTVWDTVVIDKPGLTLQEFIDEFARVHHGCVIDALYPMSGGAKPGTMLYSAMDAYDASKKEALKKKLETPLVDLWIEQVGPIFPKERNFMLFDSSVEDESGEVGIVPMIRYNFRM